MTKKKSATLKDPTPPGVTTEFAAVRNYVERNKKKGLPERKTKRIRVVATRDGFDGLRFIREGAVFVIDHQVDDKGELVRYPEEVKPGTPHPFRGELSGWYMLKEEYEEVTAILKQEKEDDEMDGGEGNQQSPLPKVRGGSTQTGVKPEL